MSSKLALINLVFFTFLVTSQSLIIPENTKHIYKYESIVILDDLLQTPFSSGYKMESVLSVSSVWNDANKSQLLHIALETPKLSTKVSDKRKSDKYTLRKSKKLTSITNLEFYLILKDDVIEDFYSLSDDKNDVYISNLKRGLASLFQFHISDKLTTEIDVSGECNVIYSSKSSTKYSKFKSNCRNWDLKINFRHENPLGISSNSFQEINYDLTQDGFLNKLESIERHSRYANVKPDVGSKIESRIILKLLSSHDAEQLEGKNLPNILENLKNFEKFNIESDIDGKVNQIKTNFKQLLKQEIPKMKTNEIGKLSSAKILMKLLPTARITKTKEFLQTLKSPSTQEIQYQLIDVLAATQTIDSHNAFLQFVDLNNEDDFNVIEKYLQALAISTRPNVKILQDLFDRLKATKTDKIQNEILRDTLLQTLSAIAFKYSKFSPNGYDDKIITKLKEYILHKLDKCEEDDCKLVYIRGLQNLRNPETIDLLLSFALTDKAEVAIAAMKALQKFEKSYFNNKNLQELEKMFFQLTKKFDSSVRILSFDILCKLKPTKEQLTNYLKYLNSNDKAFEVKTYVIQKFRMLSSKCPRFKALIEEILSENLQINNYDIIAQKGLTTVLERPLSKSPAFNETLLSVQEIFKGVLKQGTVDLLLSGGNEQFSTFQLGLYTRGLSSFASTSDSNDVEEDEAETSTAGMEIAVQDIQLRPLVLFTGQSELMGHVWSGTASEPTDAYKATVLQQDHEEYILLQNGATIYVNILGSKSIDLNGQVEISIWNRNAQTKINQNSGIAIDGIMEYRTSFVHMENKFTVDVEPKVNVKVDLDFYSEIMLCIQFGNPSAIFTHKIEKVLQILDTKYSNRNSIKFSHKLNGNTLALNQKNNEMCNKIAS